MYPGFLHYDGLEVANAVRTKTYAENLGLGWFRPQESCSGMAGFLTDYPYTTPAGDLAPWYDATRRESLDFAGFWPLEVTGIDTTTYARPVSERLDDGGVLGLGRHASRAIVVRGVLIGKTDESISAGASWLTSILERRACNHSPLGPDYRSCQGAALDYLALCPGACGCGNTECDQACFDQWQRHLYGVGLVQGPEVLRRRCIHGGGAFAEVQFTMVATNPWRYGRTLDTTTSPFAFTYLDFETCFAPDYQYLIDNVGAYSDIYQLLYSCLYPTGGPTATQTIVAPTASMPTVTPYGPTPIVDPSCPPPPAYPFFPPDSIDCSAPWDGSWNRRSYRIAGVDVERWVEQVPIVGFHDEFNVHEDVRIRFTPETGDPDTDWMSEFYVNYLPADAALSLNAVSDAVTTLRPEDYGVPESAEHLVTISTRGQAWRWPVVACGEVWTVTVDLPAGETFDAIDISLLLVAREP